MIQFFNILLSSCLLSGRIWGIWEKVFPGLLTSVPNIASSDFKMSRVLTSALGRKSKEKTKEKML